MEQWKSDVRTNLNQLTEDVSLNFNVFQLAFSLYKHGSQTVDLFISDPKPEKVGKDFFVEPLPREILLQYKDHYPDFLVEVFHGKIVQLWQNCLTDIFSICAESYLQGHEFVEFDAQKDFVKIVQSNENLNTKKGKMVYIFEFRTRFVDRQKLINSILSAENYEEKPLQNITKNILIRNSLQHRRSVVDRFSLDELCLPCIPVLDSNGDERCFKEGEKIVMSIPEMYAFMQSIFRVAFAWAGKKW